MFLKIIVLALIQKKKSSTISDNFEGILSGILGGFGILSLLNELARLTVFSAVKRASSFNRDVRVSSLFLVGTRHRTEFRLQKQPDLAKISSS